jgi:hypothetical protein
VVVVVVVQPYPLEQLSLREKAISVIVAVGRAEISSREIAHMEVGQCGNQEAHVEGFCRRRRTARAITARGT